MISRTIPEILGGPKRVALIASAAMLTLPWLFPRGHVKAGPTPNASDPGAAIAVFRGDTLDDLARLLRPLTMSSTASSGAQITLYLRDAVYAGAINGEARLVTLWLTAGTKDATAILTHSDTMNSLSTIADRLAQGSLSGSSFVLIPAKVGWQDWTLSVSPAGDAVVRAPSGAGDIQSAVSNATSALLRADTRSVTIPIGYDQTKATAWSPWFDSDQVVIRIVGIPVGATSPRPDIGILGGKAGLLVGEGFLNDIFSNEYKNRIWATQANQDLYRVRDIRLTAQPQTLLVAGNLMDVPAPAMVALQATLSGDDLKPSRISGTVDCRTLPIGACLALQAKINVGTTAITAKLVNQGQPVRPDGVQSLGNFSIGSKVLHGVSRVDQMQSAQSTLVFFGVFRFQGGRLP